MKLALSTPLTSPSLAPQSDINYPKEEEGKDDDDDDEEEEESGQLRGEESPGRRKKLRQWRNNLLPPPAGSATSPRPGKENPSSHSEHADLANGEKVPPPRVES